MTKFGIGLIGVDKERFPENPIVLDPWKFYDLSDVKVFSKTPEDLNSLEYHISTKRAKEIIYNLKQAIKLVEPE